MPKEIFVSYSRNNKRAARQLVKDLKGEGYTVWFDENSIPGSAQWISSIEDGIEQAQVFMLVLTPDSAKSEWVLREINHAQSHGKTIIPLLYKQTPLPLIINTTQYIDFTQNRGKALRQLLNDLQPHITHQNITPQITKQESNKAMQTYLKKLDKIFEPIAKSYILIVLVAVATIVSCAYLIFDDGDQSKPTPTTSTTTITLTPSETEPSSPTATNTEAPVPTDENTSVIETEEPIQPVENPESDTHTNNPIDASDSNVRIIWDMNYLAIHNMTDQSISLEGLRLVTTVQGSRVLLEDFDALNFTSQRASAHYCYIYIRNNMNPIFPDECNDAATSLERLAEVNIFWIDNGQFVNSLGIFKGEEFVATCSSVDNKCEFYYPQ